MAPTLTAERLRELLNYDPETGEFMWLVSSRNSRALVGKIIRGYRAKNGYFSIRLDGRLYYAHRLAWLWMTGQHPTRFIDHKDVNPSNNKWENLRQANDSTSAANTRARKNNKLKTKGVSRYGNGGKFVAYITKDRKRHYLGVFETKDEAHAAYIEKANELFSEFARAA